jgi:hypothetical protein
MATKQNELVSIKAPNIQTAQIEIEGLTPLVQNKFSKKAKDKMMFNMAAGSTAKSKKTRDARDYDEDFHQAQHISEEGWIGIPAPAFRSAMISACRLVGFQMTKAKLSVFVMHDGIDAEDGTPLVKLKADAPERHEALVRMNFTSTDIRIRPMWRKWGAKVNVQWDADQFTMNDIINLMDRAGMQVGIGEGRPDSKTSTGMGWGQFRVVRI